MNTDHPYDDHRELQHMLEQLLRGPLGASGAEPPSAPVPSARQGELGSTASDSPEDPRAAWETFAARLEAHLEAEERQLFPELAARRAMLRPIVRKLQRDHDQMRAAIGQIRQALDTPSANETTADTLQELLERLETHAEEERRLVYPPSSAHAAA